MGIARRCPASTERSFTHCASDSFRMRPQESTAGKLSRSAGEHGGWCFRLRDMSGRTARKSVAKTEVVKMTRKLTMTSVAIAALVIGALGATAAFAGDQGQPPPPQPPGPGVGPGGPQGPGGPGGPGMGPGRRMGPRLGMRRGYIEPCPESKALWDKLGKLQIALHRKQWELFELLAQDEPNREAIKATLKEIAQIRREMAKVHQELRKYWKPLPGAGGERPGPGRGRGRGRWGRGGGHGPGPHGPGGGQLPPPGE